MIIMNPPDKNADWVITKPNRTYAREEDKDKRTALHLGKDETKRNGSKSSLTSVTERRNKG